MDKSATIRHWLLGISLMILGVGMSTNSMGGVGDFAKEMAARVLEPRHASWKEDVLLHDGRKIIVERTQSYGGYAEPASTDRSVAKEEWAIPIPDSSRKVIWSSDFSHPPEGDSLMLLQINLLNDVPYVATSPAGCLSYNHWKRPNPPYVFFRHDGKRWKQIPLSEFPVAFKAANVHVGKPIKAWRKDTIDAEMIKEEHRNLEPYLREIIREPLKSGSVGVSCEELVYYKGAWVGPGDSIGRRMMDRMSK